MKQLSCLLLEDTEVDARALRQLLEELPLLYQIEWCQNLEDGLIRLSTKTYDLIFLDIRMPGLLGIDLLRDTPQRPPVIVVTAYIEYAVPCYDLQVADFLVKPFDRSRLQRAINRALTSNLSHSNIPPVNSIFLPANRRMQQFHYKDICFIEAHGAYIKIHGPQGITVVSQSISWIETQLPASQFMRIQKSFLINLDHITAMETRSVWIGETKLTVGAPYRDQLKQFMISLRGNGKYPEGLVD